MGRVLNLASRGILIFFLLLSRSALSVEPKDPGKSCIPSALQAAVSHPRMTVIITGPTTVGKTEVVRGLVLAENGHVINADMLYQYGERFSIGTGLSDSLRLPQERMHLYGTLKPSEGISSPSEYVERVIGTLNNINVQSPIFFDGASDSYLNKLIQSFPDLILIVLKWPDHYDIRGAVSARVDRAINAGLLTETKGLIADGLDQTPVFIKSPVYRIVTKHLNGKITLDQMKKELVDAGTEISMIQAETLNRLPGLNWVESDPLHPEQTIREIQTLMARWRETGAVAIGNPISLEGKETQLYRILTNDLSQLKGPVAEGFQLAIKRYKEKYPHHAERVDAFFREELLRLSPERTTCFTISKLHVPSGGVTKVVGFGMLYSGQEFKSGKAILPIERHLPKINVRTTTNGQPTDNIMELGKLATQQGEANISDLMKGVAAVLHSKYGDHFHIPKDLNIVGMVENERLVQHYIEAGFKVKFTPTQTGHSARWVIEISGRELYERYR